MHPDGFPVPQERDFYWKIFVLSFKTTVTDRISEKFPSNDRPIKRQSRAKVKSRFSAIEPIAINLLKSPKSGSIGWDTASTTDELSANNSPPTGQIHN